MKKIISIIAALAMVGAFVGCGPIEFSEQTVTLSNAKASDTAYYITSVEINEAGKECLDVDIAMGSSGHQGNIVTMKSKKAGDAIVTFKSSVHGKIAQVSVTVYSSGMIMGTSKLQYTTFNGDEYGSVQSAWVDDTSVTLNPEAETAYYADDSNTESNMQFLFVKGNILYLMKYKNGADQPTTTAGKSSEFYYWARGIANVTSENKIDKIVWTTYGSVMASGWTDTMKASGESWTSNSVSTTGLTGSNLTYTYNTLGADPKITIGEKSYTKLTDGDYSYFVWPTTWGRSE